MLLLCSWYCFVSWPIFSKCQGISNDIELEIIIHPLQFGVVIWVQCILDNYLLCSLVGQCSGSSATGLLSLHIGLQLFVDVAEMVLSV